MLIAWSRDATARSTGCLQGVRNAAQILDHDQVLAIQGSDGKVDLQVAAIELDALDIRIQEIHQLIIPS
jgi:hypothetical protein